MTRFTAQQRRTRLARRHRLAPGHHAADVEAAAASLVCLHATDPATTYLSAWARVPGFRVVDLDRAIYERRTLVKHLAMRRTLFVIPRSTLAVAQHAASDRVAATERKRLIADVEKAGLHRDGAAWLSAACADVLAALSGGRAASIAELRDELPSLQGHTVSAPHKRWGGKVSVGPRVLTVLSASGAVVRGPNDGGWATARPRWVTMASWLGGDLPPIPPDEATTELVRQWLRAFGPGTATDLKWWLGSTLGTVRRALAALGAVEVELDDGTGSVLPDDLEPDEPVDPWAALLPPLDPTTMGWIERDWYLGPYRRQLVDSTGNAGPTIWWCGRIVGGWRQHGDGTVQLQLLEDVGTDALTLMEQLADRLTTWLAGKRVLPRFPSPLSRGEAAVVPS